MAKPTPNPKQEQPTPKTQQSRSSKTHRKRHGINKMTLITVAAIVTVGVGAPIGYTKWWIPTSDAKVYARVQEDTKALLENEYTGAVKEDVTSADLANINRDIKKIHDDKLKNKLEETTKSIRDQVEVQTRAQERLARIQAEKNFADVKTDDAEQLLRDAQQIKNVELRATLLRESNLVIDRYNNTKSVIAEVDSLKVGDWPGYYSAEANVDTVGYAEVKKELKDKLKEVKKKNEASDKEKAKSAESDLAKEVKAAEAVTYDNSVVKGKSNVTELPLETTTTTTTTSNSSAEDIAKSYFNSNSGTRRLILINNDRIYLFAKNGSSVRSLASESIEGTGWSVTETTNVGVGVGSDGNGGTEEIVKVSDLIISSSISADIRVSSSFLNKLISELNDNSTGVTFLVR